MQNEIYFRLKIELMVILFKSYLRRKSFKSARGSSAWSSLPFSYVKHPDSFSAMFVMHGEEHKENRILKTLQTKIYIPPRYHI